VFAALIEAALLPSSAGGVLLRCAIVSGAAAILGLPQWALVFLATRRIDATRVSNAWEAATSRTADDRGPVLWFHAAALSLLVGVAGLTTVTAWVTLRLRRVDEDPFVALLTVVFVIVAAVGSAVVTVAGTRWLPALLGKLDARVRLPIPGGVPGFMLYACVPVALFTTWIIVNFRHDLGTLTLVFIAAPFVALEWLSWRLLFRRSMSRRARHVALVSWFVAVLTALHLFPSVEGARRLVKQGFVFPASVRALQDLTDVDRDGFSHKLAGGDCAPWDRARNPNATEIFGNDVDEDCDGDAPQAASKDADGGRLLYGKVPADQVRRYNIVWIVVDALRADAVGFTDYRDKPKLKGRSATPYLDELAKESWVFDNAYSQSSMTMLSMPSMFAGRWPGKMTWRSHTDRPNVVDEETLIAEQLKEAGYRTGKVASGYLVGRLPGQFQGQDEVLNYWFRGKRSPWYKLASRVAVALGVDFLKQDPDFPLSETPFFLTLYTDGPHNQYIVHPDSGFKVGKSRRSRYQGEVADTDQMLKFLLEYLRYQDEGSLWENTIVIVSADHGEEFKEHGNINHARTCHEESVHVPLLVRIPGMEPRHIDTPVALVDVVPTLLDFVGLEPPRDDLDGQSLAIPALEPEALDPHRPIFCTTTSVKASFGDFLRRSVRRDGLVFMTDLRNSEELFFDSTGDLSEQKNLIQDAARAAEVKKLREELSRTLTGNIAKLSFF